MQTARHTVNDTWSPQEGGPLPTAGGLELEATVARVLAWGGHAGRYRAGVLAGLEQLMGTELDGSEAKSLCSVAGWRAGAFALRKDALGHVAAAAEGRGLALPAVAAVLGLEAAEVGPFVEGQRENPLAWPRLSPGDAVAAIGGFSGLGGPWLAPPTRVATTADRCRYVVWTGQQAWDVFADVFCSRVSRSEAPPQEDAERTSPLEHFHDTYFVWAFLR